MKENIIDDKAYRFAIRIVNMFKYLTREKKEFTLSKQCLRSGTSIGALVKESFYAQSRRDFISKISIAAKEALETRYWLSLLCDTGYIDATSYKSIANDCNELIKILSAILISTKKSLTPQPTNNS